MAIFNLLDSEEWHEIRVGLIGHGSTMIADLFAVNVDGMTPLAVAVSNPRVPQDIILHLIRLNSKALYQPSKSLSIPLHYACESGSVATVDTLIKSAFDILGSASNGFHTTLDINERTPLERAWLSYLTSKSFSIDYSEPLNFPISDQTGERHCARKFSMELLELWQKTESILNAFHSKRSHIKNKRYILHQIAQSGRECLCPNVVMWFALKLGFKNQLYITDEDGNLPLHIAACQPVHKILFIRRTSQFSPFMNKSVMEILIRAYPHSCLVANKRNNLPLHLAIKSGKTFNEGVGTLLRACPETANIIDRETKLYPFQLSASIVEFTDDDTKVALRNQSEKRLDLIFQLLQRNPDLIQNYPQTTKKRSNEEIASCCQEFVSKTKPNLYQK